MKRGGPLRRKKSIRRVSKAEIKAKDLDKLCREATFTRDGGKCLRCSAEQNLNWAHVYSRRYKSLRWNLNNVMSLCAACHFWWHDRTLEAAEWFNQTFPSRFAILKALVGIKVKPRQMVEIRDYLESELRQIKAGKDNEGWPQR